MKLYSFWRSTTSYRVRAALHLKGIAFETVPVDLTAGAQCAETYTALNPSAGVPTLVLNDGTVLTQSLAILDYLDAVYPDPPLLPDDPVQRAKVRAAAHCMALDVHPVNNLRVVKHLKATHGATEETARAWMLHWMDQGCAALEAQIDPSPFCFGDTPSLADLCVVAQLYNAKRWGLDMTLFPKLQEVDTACLAHPAIAAAHPDQQPDARP